MCGVEIGEGEYAAIYDIIYENEKRSCVLLSFVVCVVLRAVVF